MILIKKVKYIFYLKENERYRIPRQLIIVTRFVTKTEDALIGMCTGFRGIP